MLVSELNTSHIPLTSLHTLSTWNSAYHFFVNVLGILLDPQIFRENKNFENGH